VRNSTTTPREPPHLSATFSLSAKLIEHVYETVAKTKELKKRYWAQDLFGQFWEAVSRASGSPFTTVDFAMTRFEIRGKKHMSRARGVFQQLTTPTTRCTFQRTTAAAAV